MEVIITDWALRAYVDLKHTRVFTSEEFETVIRPNVEILKEVSPFENPVFQNSKFWGPATDRDGRKVVGGFKMKWHNMGSGRIQLRLPIFIEQGKAWLCRAYVKKDEKTDRREMGQFKIHIQMIREGYPGVGKL